MKQEVLSKTNSETLSTAAGIGSALMGAAVTQPFDVIATIKQESDGALTSTQAIRQIYSRKGVLGFVSGLTQRMFLFAGCAYIIPKIAKKVKDQLIKDRD